MRPWSVFLLFLLCLVVVSPVSSAEAQSAQTTEVQSGRKVVSKVIPVYPAAARVISLAGTVRLEALVLANGTAKSIQVKGGNPLLAQAAQNAVREWKWAKADHESTETLEFKFKP